MNKPYTIVDLILETKVVSSKNEAKRLIEQGAVEIDGIKITNPNTVIIIKVNET